MENFKVKKIYVLHCFDEKESIKLCRKVETKIILKDILTQKDINYDEIESYYPLIEDEQFKDKKTVTRKELYDYVLSKNANLNQSKIDGLDEKVLKEATVKFFKENINLTATSRDASMVIDKKYLINHLRDELWLAKMLKKDQNLYFIGINKILYFIKNSSFFKREREKFELEVVKFQIINMLNNSEMWLTSDDDFLSAFTKNDEVFRNSVIKILKKIGIDEEAIEKGLEMYSYIWQDVVMEKTFRNIYYPGIEFNDSNLLEDTYSSKDIATSENYKKAWLKLRKYEYYKKHKDSVDKYGTSSLVIEEDVEKLKNLLNKMNKKRLEYLENIKLKDKRSFPKK